MRVASFNVLHGRSPGDGVVDPARLVAAVKALDADVLGLQEVDRAQPRSHHLDLTAIAAEAMGATEARFVPALLGTPGRGWRAARGDDTDPDEPAYGVALLSRRPVTSWATVQLPPTPWRRPRDEPRVAVGALLDDVSVFTTHLGFVPAWNRLQLRKLLLTLRGLPGPQLLTGDLNIEGRLPRLLREWHPLVEGATFPARAPRVQLDHILARRFSPHVLRAEIVDLPVSDHLGVVVELSW